MKVLGVGLSRTGTLSLHAALEILGLKSLHYDTVRLNDVLDGGNRLAFIEPSAPDALPRSFGEASFPVGQSSIQFRWEGDDAGPICLQCQQDGE